LKKKYSLREIAWILHRSVSTISDELRRNRVKGRYDAAKADHKSYVRRLYARHQGMKIVESPLLRKFIETSLSDDQSPINISGRLRTRKECLPYVSKTTIYEYIQTPYGRQIEYHRSKLRRKRRRKKPRTKPWKDRVFIDKRPAGIQARIHVGHTEGDFIVSGKSGKGVLLVIVEKKLRVTFLERILSVTTDEVTRACRKVKKRYPEWKSMTTDNDLLFQHHRELEQKIGIRIYFCFPGHMWEKPQVENRNTWLRRYILKGSDISKYSKRFIRNLETKINNQYMQVLKHRTPSELLTEYRTKKHHERSASKKKT